MARIQKPEEIKKHSKNSMLRVNEDGLYEVDNKDFILALLTIGYTIQRSRLKGKGSHTVIFEFDPLETVELPGLGAVSLVEVHEMWVMSSPPIPCADIRRLANASSMFNFHVYNIQHER